MSNIFPNFLEDPKTGVIDESVEKRIACKRCIKYGIIGQPPEDRSTGSENLDDHLITSPCTICAMKNDGYWGWSPGNRGKDEFRLQSFGTFPGSSGITDVLGRHASSIKDDMNWDVNFALEHQIILGFVQYALYNHLTWNDILNPSDEVDMDTYYDDEYDGNWYWWKVIPRNLKLPERFKTLLFQMIVDYPDDQHDGCVPKTIQKMDGEGLTDEVWPDFMKTYVEPSHVSWIFRETLNKVLSEHCWLAVSEENEDNIPCIGNYFLNNFTIYTVRPGEENLHNTLSERGFIQSDIENIMNTTIISPHNEERQYFIHEMELGIVEYIKIFDRDIFGTNLTYVTEYDWTLSNTWLQRRDIYENPNTNILEHRPRPLGWEKRLWNLENESIDRLTDNVYKVIGFEDTSYWENIQRFSGITWVSESDYTNEYNFREYLEEGQGHIEYEVYFEEDGDEEEEEESMNKEEFIEKLKNIQTFVDENVKGSVQEVVYLNLMNKLCDIYNYVKK